MRQQLCDWWLHPAGRVALLAIVTGALATLTALAGHPVLTGYLFLLAVDCLRPGDPRTDEDEREEQEHGNSGPGGPLTPRPALA